MSRRIRVTLLVISCLISLLSYGQGKKQYYEAYIALGDSCYAHANYFGAHQAYEKALAYIDNPNIAFRCAEACRGYQNYTDAEKYYKIAISKDSITFYLANYWYAEMLKLQGKYSEAKAQYEIHYQLNKGKNDYYTRRAKEQIDILDKKILKIGESVGLEVKHISQEDINSMYAEYAPCQYNDTLFFFAGVRPLDVKLADTSYIYANYLTRVLQANRRNDSTWVDVKEVKSLKDPKAHVSNLSFTKDGKTVYFSKCIGYNCSIYKADFDPQFADFSNITKLPAPINMAQTSNTTPQIACTSQGNYLFFASNRKGTKGGYDIWYSELDSTGKFTTVQNCGKNINTLGDEVTPFYDSRDSLLYYSSEWHTSLGGFDIFSSKGNLKHGRWSNSVNIGQPINSSYNDLYYNYSRDSLRAYWCSNREGSIKLIGKAFSNDIYSHSLVRRSVARITDLIPITLYFDNDYPDPRSKDSVTDKIYENLYNDFMAKREEYIDEYTRYSSEERLKYDIQTVQAFFGDMQQEFQKLSLFAELMSVILQDGQDIVVAFKGYASPVGNLAYNEIVAKKRISCIQNYFLTYNNGVLNQYLHNQPKSGKGSLKYVYEPIGVVKMENTFYTSTGSQVSALSDRRQKWMSVYSPAAAYQRKIEIIAVDIEYEDQLFEEIKREITTQKKMVDEVDGTSLYKEGEESKETEEQENSGTSGFMINEVDEQGQNASDPTKLKPQMETSSPIKFEMVEEVPNTTPVKSKQAVKTPTETSVSQPKSTSIQTKKNTEEELKKYEGDAIFKAK